MLCDIIYFSSFIRNYHNIHCQLMRFQLSLSQLVNGIKLINICIFVDVVSFSTPQHAPCCGLLYDHQLLKLNEDDFDKVYHIPKKKGPNFRDLLGILVSPDKKV
ncbi:hypothetical protein Pint_34076 [Pistacia integerrima]|uniref:Uncharacterized protein n=1 Tax=Pistacia integerrima TaxID=434235 RepID=A0ACC0X6B9_9ROSI|nr:hypothetical protein Pint_34076 [Pistacia integerrima]